MDSSKKVDVFSGIIILIVSITLFISTFGFQQMTESRVGSAFFPQIASVSMAVMSVLLIISPFIQKKIKEKNAERKDEAESDENAMEQYQVSKSENEENEKKYYGLVVLTIVLLITCVALLQPLGFIISTTIFLFLQMCIMSKKNNRKYITFIIVSIATSGLIYWIFKGFFNLMLPAGLLG